MLTGLVYCGHCGLRMYGARSGRSYLYRCVGQLEHGGCPVKNINGPRLDSSVKAKLSRTVMTSESRERAIATVRKQEADRSSTVEAQRRELLRSRARHEEARLQLARGLLGQAGKLIPPDVYARLESEELEAIHAIDRALESTPVPEPFDLTPVLNFLQGASWDSFDEEAWGEAVEFIVTKVVVSPDKSWQIEYRQPGLFAHFTTAAELESW